MLWRGVVYATLMAAAKVTVGFPIMLWSVISWPDVRTAGRSFAYSVRRTAVCSHRRTTASARTEDGVANEAQDVPLSRTADAAPRLSSLRTSAAPAAFMGIAMVARGEIGLLIAQVARGSEPLSGGSASGSGSLLGEESYLVCIWAILLCTLVGPIGIGFIVRRWETRIRGDIWG